MQTAFPGTPLYARLKSEDRILRDEAWELCTLFDVNFKPAKMSVAELESGFRSLVERIYSDEFTKARRDEFHRNFRRRLRQRNTVSRRPMVGSLAQEAASHSIELDANLLWPRSANEIKSR